MLNKHPDYKISFYGIHCWCWWDDQDMEPTLEGTNWLNNFLLPVVANIHVGIVLFNEFFMPWVRSGDFPIKILEKYDKTEVEELEVQMWH
jgi:hypothetical protein